MSDANKKTTKKGEQKNSKPLYIFLSILASLALWVYVTYVDNPEIETTVTGIPVDFVGEEILKDNDLMVTSVNTNRLNVSYGGKWNAISTLDESGITAEVDLSQIVSRYSANPGTYMLGWDLRYADFISLSGVECLGANYNYITVTVERTIDKNVQVMGVFEGDVAEGYSAQPLVYSVNTITVSGPRAVVEQVDHAWVVLQRDNVTRSISETVDVVLRDENDQEIDSTDLSLSDTSVTVTLRVIMEKDVALIVNLANGASASDRNTKFEVNPSTITLRGDPELLEGLNHIVLGTIDLTNFALTTKQTFTIPIPNDVANVNNITSAEVTVNVFGLSTRRFTVENLETANDTVGYSSIIITEAVDVLLRGEDTYLRNIGPEDIRIIADLTELGNTTGTFTVPAKVYVDGFPKVDAIGQYSVTVQIIAGEGQPRTQSDNGDGQTE